MYAILKKEFTAFFTSIIGYFIIGLFLLINGLLLFVFKSEHNVLDNGFADLSSFFELSPWVFLFLIPAITMRSFAEEKKQGTLELLLTKPLSNVNIVFGKYLGVMLLICIALLPTLLYVYTIYQLGNPIGNIETGSVIGSYFGLFLLASCYTSIGLFTSALTKNQIFAFISSIAICLFLQIGLQGIANFTASSSIENLSIQQQFNQISQGIINSRNVLYFVSITLCFMILSAINIQHKPISKALKLKTIGFIFSLLIINGIASQFYYQLDLTNDKRFTLSQTTKTIIKDIKKPIIIDVFLEGDDFPSHIRRLQTEIKQLLNQFSNQNYHIKFQFFNPIEDLSTRQQNLQLLNQRGLTPMMLTVQENGKTQQEPIIPWALASYNNTTIEIPLIKNKTGATQQALIQNSVQHLEYAFVDAFSKLIYPKQKKIAILKGNKQLKDKYISKFLQTLKDYYFIAPFTLDSVAKTPNKTLQQLENYDLIISAKPTEAFSEKEKYILDQYTMQGGKSLWLIDQVSIEKDSLYNDKAEALAINNDLNLNDFFFKYGARINPLLVQDLYSDPITLATGVDNNTQLIELNWPYSPLANGNNQHPITKNLNLVKFDFANSIDTIKTGQSNITKTILLKSSPLSKTIGTPKIISIKNATKQQNPSAFKNKGNIPLAVLLEGKFNSVYDKRVKPLQLQTSKPISPPTKMIIVSDGNIIKNEIDAKGNPIQLGFNRRTGILHGNKEFLLNAVNYLLDDNGLINIRTKNVAIAYLNTERITKEKLKWQLINILIPLITISIFAFGFKTYRKKRYAKPH